MIIDRDVWTDRRFQPARDYDRLQVTPAREGDGCLPMVFITPSDRPLDFCEVGECRVTRNELRQWAEAILHTLETS